MLRKYAMTEILSATMAPVNDPLGLARFAHRHHFDYEPRPGYLYVRSRAISSRTNDNFDTFPAEEIEKAYASFIGKPVFVNHNNDNHRRARGVVIDAALHKDANPDGSPDTWTEVLMEVDAVRFPKLAQAILAGHIDRTSMGTDVAYSLCSFCGNKATTPLEYCQHIPKMKGKRIYRTTASGTKEGVLVSEICHGLKFFENSLLVEEPADPTAYFLGVEGHGVKTASKIAVADPSEPDYNKHYHRGWGASVRGSDGTLDRADGRGEHEAWYDGYYDHATGRSKWHSRDNRDEDGYPITSAKVARKTAVGTCPDCGKPADHFHISDESRQQMIDVSNASKLQHEMHQQYQKTPVNTNDHADLLHHMLTAHEGHDSLQHYTHPELQEEHDSEHQTWGAEEWPDSVHMDGHHFHEAKVKRMAAQVYGGVSFPNCGECGATDHHTGQHNFGEPHGQGAHEHVAYVDDGIYCKNCVEHGDPKWGKPSHTSPSQAGAISWAELRVKQPHGTTCENCHKEIVPERPHTENECEYGGDCHDAENHLHENSPMRATFGTDEDREDTEAETKFWQVAGPEHAKMRDERHQSFEDNARSQVPHISPDADRFLKGNPSGPTHYSSLRPRTAYGEQMAPADVDTLREEECPVCGEADAYDGNECQICGFVAPPDMFMDPDLDVAKQMDLRGDQQGMQPDPLGQQPPLDPSQVPDPTAMDPNAQVDENGMPLDQAPIDPSQVDENGQPIEGEQPQVDENGNPIEPQEGDEDNPFAQGDEQAPDGQQEETPLEQGQGDPGTPADGVGDLTCPVCGFVADATPPQSVDMNSPQGDPGQMAEGSVCPQCGQGQLVSIKQVEESLNQPPMPMAAASLFPVILL